MTPCEELAQKIATEEDPAVLAELEDRYRRECDPTGSGPKGPNPPADPK